MTAHHVVRRVCRVVLAVIGYTIASVVSFAMGFFGVLLIVDYLPHTLT